MTRLLRALALALAAAALVSPATASADRLDGISGPQALATQSLAGTWAFVPAGGEQTPIEVPGGGWYKQGFTDVAAASYRRTITVPDVAPDQVVELNLGAVN